MKIIVLVISIVTKIVYVTIRTHFENRLVDPNWNDQLYLFIYGLKQNQDFLLIDQKEINHPRLSLDQTLARVSPAHIWPWPRLTTASKQFPDHHLTIAQALASDSVPWSSVTSLVTMSVCLS